MEKLIECFHLNECSGRKQNKCHKCKNNKKRNYEADFFVEANDNPIPDKCPKLTYDGPAEQTRGYKCPVCGGFTNPYMIFDKLCSHCGYKLNI